MYCTILTVVWYWIMWDKEKHTSKFRFLLSMELDNERDYNPFIMG